MIKELKCIRCPMGCKLKIDIEKKDVTGNKCRRGRAYGVSEAVKENIKN